MPEVILNCPQCQRQLRVTEDLLGRPVKCPACGLTFTVPGGSSEPQPVLTVVPAEVPGRPPAEADEPRLRRRRPDLWNYEQSEPRRAHSLLAPPAITLIVLSLLGLLGDILQVVVWSTMADQVLQQAQAMNLVAGEPPPPLLMIVIHAVSAVLCLVILLAAVQMLRMRMYPLALIGCFLPLFNVGSYCCLPSLPVGIWALVILVQPHVRDAFARQATPGAG